MSDTAKRDRVWLVAVLAACAICVLVRVFLAEAKQDELHYDAATYQRLAEGNEGFRYTSITQERFGNVAARAVYRVNTDG